MSQPGKDLLWSAAKVLLPRLQAGYGDVLQTQDDRSSPPQTNLCCIARIMMCTTPERKTVCVASNSISASMSMCCVFYSLVNVRFQLFLQFCEAAAAENTFPCSAASQ